jgi:hypothetical protein
MALGCGCREDELGLHGGCNVAGWQVVGCHPKSDLCRFVGIMSSAAPALKFGDVVKRHKSAAALVVAFLEVLNLTNSD